MEDSVKECKYKVYPEFDDILQSIKLKNQQKQYSVFMVWKK